MYVALIVDTTWLNEEGPTFRHLVVGLIDEQVRVAQVVPATVADDQLNPFGERVTWSDSRCAWMRQRHLASSAEKLEDLGVNLIHALDGRLWHGAARLARRLNSVVVLSSFSAGDVRIAGRLAGRMDSTRLAFAAGTTQLGERICHRVDPRVTVQVVRPGVHVPAQVPARARPEGAFCVVVSGTSRFDADYEALFQAMHRIIKEKPQAQFFLDGMATDQHPLWRALRRFDLLANVSLVPRGLGHRELLSGADLLILPQALNCARGLTLQAMAYGLPVAARADPWLDYLVPDRTAWVVTDPQTTTWYQLMRRAMDDPAQGRQLGEQARQWVRQRHLAAHQVAETLRLYRQLSGVSLKFPSQVSATDDRPEVVERE